MQDISPLDRAILRPHDEAYRCPGFYANQNTWFIVFQMALSVARRFSHTTVRYGSVVDINTRTRLWCCRQDPKVSAAGARGWRSSFLWVSIVLLGGLEDPFKGIVDLKHFRGTAGL